MIIFKIERLITRLNCTIVLRITQHTNSTWKTRFFKKNLIKSKACTRETSSVVFHSAFEIRGEREGCLQRFEGAVEEGEGVEDGCGCEMVARRQPPIINHTMIHSIVPSASPSRLKRKILERKLELPRERSPLLAEGERLPRPREEAIYHSWNLLSTNPATPQPHKTLPRASQHHPPSLSSSFSSFSIQTCRRSLPAC